jgi:hypothetical protein
MWIAAVTSVGVRDDKWPKVMRLRCSTLRIGHARSKELLISIRCEQGSH